MAWNSCGLYKLYELLCFSWLHLGNDTVLLAQLKISRGWLVQTNAAKRAFCQRVGHMFVGSKWLQQQRPRISTTGKDLWCWTTEMEDMCRQFHIQALANGFLYVCWSTSLWVILAVYACWYIYHTWTLEHMEIVWNSILLARGYVSLGIFRAETWDVLNWFGTGNYTQL